MKSNAMTKAMNKGKYRMNDSSNQSTTESSNNVVETESQYTKSHGALLSKVYEVT